MLQRFLFKSCDASKKSLVRYVHSFVFLTLHSVNDKCRGNPRNANERFKYDAATDTCSKYYQSFFVYNIFVKFCRCVYHTAKVLGVYVSSQFHTLWDLHCEELLCVSLVGRTMYFHSRSLPIFEMCQLVRENLSMYKIKTSDHGKCFNDFYSRVAMHRKSHSFATFTRSFFWRIATRE